MTLDLTSPTLPRPARLPCPEALAVLERAMLRDHGRELDSTRAGVARTELVATVAPRGAL